ncbi:MAG: WD40/YVTN/BNR-like repeat-containing protein [Anaerolineae bacterium]
MLTRSRIGYRLAATACALVAFALLGLSLSALDLGAGHALASPAGGAPELSDQGDRDEPDARLTQATGETEYDEWVPLWEVYYGGFRKLTDIAPVSDTEAWGIDANVVVGTGDPRGQTLYVHRIGDSWRVAQVEDGPQMLAIDIAPTGFGVAVGEKGAIQQYEGWRWQSVRSPTVQRLTDVSLVSSSKGWAVGNRGTILEWDGSDWEQVEVPEEIRVFQISAVAAVSNSDAWATCTGGQMLHYGGGDWEEYDSPALVGPTGIAFDASGRGMAVGYNVLELSGGEWREIESPGPTLTSVAWHDGIAYAAGDGDLWQYADGAWSLVELPDTPDEAQATEYRLVAKAAEGVWGTSADTGAVVLMAGGPATYVRPSVRALLAIDMISTTLGWTGGAAQTAGLVGSLDGSWSQEIAMPSGTEVRGIDLVSDTDGWAIGRQIGSAIEARLWRWDGTDWTRWPIEKTWDISNIEMVGPDDGYANGGNVIAHWNGEEWRQVTDSPPAGRPGGMAMLEGGDNPTGWFGGYGVILHIEDGEWTQQFLSDDGLVFDIEVPSPSEGWAATRSATRSALFRYDGDTWTQVDLELNTGARIEDIDAVDKGNAWLVTEDHVLYHWNGTAWALHDLAPLGVGFRTLRLKALRVDPESLATDVWLVGENPSIGRYRIVTPVGTIHLPAVVTGASLGMQ